MNSAFVASGEASEAEWNDFWAELRDIHYAAENACDRCSQLHCVCDPYEIEQEEAHRKWEERCDQLEREFDQPAEVSDYFVDDDVWEEPESQCLGCNAVISALEVLCDQCEPKDHYHCMKCGVEIEAGEVFCKPCERKWDIELLIDIRVLNRFWWKHAWHMAKAWALNAIASGFRRIR